MTKYYPTKKPPKCIAIFGAGGRMARHVVDYLRYKAPEIHLRLLASSEESKKVLQKRFPDGDIHVGNFLKRDTLDGALEGMEGVFVVTASGMNERLGMNNFVDAAKKAGAAKHIIRLVGFAPESNPKKLPARLLELGGDSDQHFTAKAILEESNLPVTYLNLNASLMENLLFTVGGIQRSHTLIWPMRDVPLMDGRDLGEVIARIFLSDDARHIGSFHTLNNGYDQPTTPEIAETMSEAFLTKITPEMSWEAFEKEYGAMIKARWGRDTEVEYRFKQFVYERENIIWCLNNLAEDILGRRATSLHSWLREHRHIFLPAG